MPPNHPLLLLSARGSGRWWKKTLRYALGSDACLLLGYTSVQWRFVKTSKMRPTKPNHGEDKNNTRSQDNTVGMERHKGENAP